MVRKRMERVWGKVVNVLDIDFLICELVAHNQTNTWRWSDGSPVLKSVRAGYQDLRKNRPPCHRIRTCERGLVAGPPLMTRGDRCIRFARVRDGRRAAWNWDPAGRTEQRCDPLRGEVGRGDVYLRRRTWYRLGRNRG